MTMPEVDRQKARALSRWESEGGALAPDEKALDAEDMRVLARLGAALLLEWDAIPAETRSTVGKTACTLHAGRDGARIQRAIARFVDEREGPQDVREA